MFRSAKYKIRIYRQSNNLMLSNFFSYTYISAQCSYLIPHLNCGLHVPILIFSLFRFHFSIIIILSIHISHNSMKKIRKKWKSDSKQWIKERIVLLVCWNPQKSCRQTSCNVLFFISTNTKRKMGEKNERNKNSELRTSEIKIPTGNYSTNTIKLLYFCI